jgi:hypothetical protein
MYRGSLASRVPPAAPSRAPSFRSPPALRSLPGLPPGIPTEWARDADEAGDLADLVALSMARDNEVQRELGPAAGGGSDDEGGGSGGGGRGGGGGVVEFGDAEDEPDWEAVGRRRGGGGGGRGGGKTAAGKKGGRGGGGAAASRAPVLAHRTGEMAHAGAPVPEAQRADIFGDAGDADAAATDWEGLGLCTTLAEHLGALNFSEPTRVQRGALPPLLAGRDACVRAPTGSGKTLAYLAPIVQQLQARGHSRAGAGPGRTGLQLRLRLQVCGRVGRAAAPPPSPHTLVPSRGPHARRPPARASAALRARTRWCSAPRASWQCRSRTCWSRCAGGGGSPAPWGLQAVWEGVLQAPFNSLQRRPFPSPLWPSPTQSFIPHLLLSLPKGASTGWCRACSSAASTAATRRRACARA